MGKAGPHLWQLSDVSYAQYANFSCIGLLTQRVREVRMEAERLKKKNRRVVCVGAVICWLHLRFVQ
jgi:hypothetical protein